MNDIQVKTYNITTQPERQDAVRAIRERFSGDLYNLLELKEIMYDKERKFPTYNPDQKVIDSEGRLREIFSIIGKENFFSFLDVGCGMGYLPRAPTLWAYPGCLASI